MQKKKFRKLIAGVLVAAMAMGMTTVSFAADATSGSGTGSGEFEGTVDQEVVKVVLPTEGDDTNQVLSYKMDPEALIQSTDAAKYDEDTTFATDASVYFLNKDGNYSESSDKLKVINKGTADVDVTLKATVADPVGYDVVTTKTWANTVTAPELYLGLVVDGKVSNTAVAEMAIPEGATGAEIVLGLKGKKDNFEVVVDSDDEYAYAAKTNLGEKAWNSFEFGLTGVCNTYGDWSDVNTATDITVTWSYAERQDSANDMLDENATAGPWLDVTSTGKVLIFGLTGEKNYKSLSITSVDGTFDAAEFGFDWDPSYTETWSDEKGGYISGQLSTEWTEYLDGIDAATLILNLTDNTTVETEYK